MAQLLYADTLKATYEETDYLFWTGNGVLNYENARWTGTYSLILVSPAGSELDGPSNRLQVVLNPRITDEVLGLLRTDLGPLPVEVQRIVSEDYGRTWNRVLLYRGKMSGQRFVSNNGTFTFDIETEDGDRDRLESSFYSDAEQRALYPTDSGFSFLEQLAQGVDLEWPS